MTTLRQEFVKDFVKFVKDNQLLPSPTLLEKLRKDHAFVDLSDPAQFPDIVVRAPKCKFYGVIFEYLGPSARSGQKGNVRITGMIKVFSPKFIQVEYMEDSSNYWREREMKTFGDFLNAIVYLNNRFIRQDIIAAAKVQTKNF